MNAKLTLVAAALVTATAAWAMPGQRLPVKMKHQRRSAVERREAPAPRAAQWQLAPADKGGLRLDSIVGRTPEGSYSSKTLVEYIDAERKRIETPYYFTERWSDEQQAYLSAWEPGGNRTETASDDQGRLTLQANYWWDAETAAWQGNNRWDWAYSADGREVTETYSNWQDGKWVYSYKDENTYDAAGNGLEHVSYQWDAATQAWVGNNRSVSTYDDRGNTLTDQTYSWDAATQSWTEYDLMEWIINPATGLVDTVYYSYLEEGVWQHQRGVYAWDNHGGQIRKTMYMKNAAGEWEKTGDYKYEDTYDAQGRLAQTIASEWYADAPVWAYSYKATYEYADNGVVTETQYNYVDGQWVPDTKYESLNDSEGRSLVSSFLQWNAVDNRWESPSGNLRYVYAYDEAGHETFFQYYEWMVEEQGWELYYERTSTYDAYGNLTFEDTYGKDNIRLEYVHISRFIYEYTYDQYGNIILKQYSGMGVARHEERYFYSPNPLAPTAVQAAVQATAPVAYVDGADIRLARLSDAAVTLHDLNGRMVATATATGGRATLAAPAPGLYVVRCGGQAVKVLVR